jgi:hypothetical protein
VPSFPTRLSSDLSSRGGTLTVDSTPGHGTSVRAVLPVADRDLVGAS